MTETDSNPLRHRPGHPPLRAFRPEPPAVAFVRHDVQVPRRRGWRGRCRRWRSCVHPGRGGGRPCELFLLFVVAVASHADPATPPPSTRKRLLSPKEKLSPCSPSLLSIVLLKNEIPCVYIQPHRADRSSESSRLVDDLRALHWWPVASGAPITNDPHAFPSGNDCHLVRGGSVRTPLAPVGQPETLTAEWAPHSSDFGALRLPPSLRLFTNPNPTSSAHLKPTHVAQHPDCLPRCAYHLRSDNFMTNASLQFPEPTVASAWALSKRSPTRPPISSSPARATRAKRTRSTRSRLRTRT